MSSRTYQRDILYRKNDTKLDHTCNIQFPTHGKHSSHLNYKHLFTKITRQTKTQYILKTIQRDATQSSLFIILQVNSACFGCQQHPSSVHKTVTTASGTGHNFCAIISLQRGQASLATLEGGSYSTEGCSYSFVYS